MENNSDGNVLGGEVLDKVDEKIGGGLSVHIYCKYSW